MKSVKNNKRNYIWNAIAGILNASEAVVMSMIVTRTTGIEEAGILTIAFAVGNLLITIGRFSIRGYQVTDVSGKYRFRTYFKTRLVTVFFMLVAAVIYLLYASKCLLYPEKKILVIGLIIAIYAIEALEDVFWGFFQGQGHLYIGAQMFALRWIGILITFFLGMAFLRNIVTVLLICLIVSALIFMMMLLIRLWDKKSYLSGILEPKKEDRAAVRGLLVQAFPLFGASFLSFYINNVPKYAIDAKLSDGVQACYGFVAMPVFVIGLLNNFVYQPTLVPLAEDYRKNDKSDFLKRVRKQFVIIAAISAVCFAGAALIGIPVLSWLYHTDLRDYWRELVILQIAGGFLAVSGYLIALLTVMRRQHQMLAGYLAVGALAFFLMNPVVERYGTLGAATGYLVLLVILCISCFMIFMINFRKMVKQNRS